MSWQPANADNYRTRVRRPDDCVQCGQQLMERGGEVRCSVCGTPADSLYGRQEASASPAAPATPPAAPAPARKHRKKPDAAGLEPAAVIVED